MPRRAAYRNGRRYQARIEELVADEHRFLDDAGERALGDHERKRMADVNVEHETAAHLRAEGTVEDYVQ